MNRVSVQLEKLCRDGAIHIDLGDLLLVCVGISDGHIYPDDIWEKYFKDTSLLTTKSLYEAVVTDMLNSPYLEGISDDRDGPVRLEITPTGEQRIWSRFSSEYIYLQSLNKPIDKPDNITDLLTKPGIVTTNSFNDSEAEITVTFHSATEIRIFEKFIESYETFVKKNRSYGNSSLEPVGVFGNLPREAKIESRMEDKLARIRNITDTRSHAYLDAIRDLRVYLFLYELALED